MEFLGALVAQIFVWFIISCIAAGCVMMGVANVHDWWSFIPTMGFWHAFSITIWFAVPVGLYSSYNRSTD